MLTTSKGSKKQMNTIEKWWRTGEGISTAGNWMPLIADYNKVLSLKNLGTFSKYKLQYPIFWYSISAPKLLSALKYHCFPIY